MPVVVLMGRVIASWTVPKWKSGRKSMTTTAALDWLKDESHVDELIEIYNHLVERADKEYKGCI